MFLMCRSRIRLSSYQTPSPEANAVSKCLCGRCLRPSYGGSNPPFRSYSSPLYQILTIFLSLIIPLPEGNLSCKGDGGWQPILVSLKNFNLRLEKDVIYRKVVGLRCYFLRKCGRVGFFRVIIYRDFFNKNIIFGFYQKTQLAKKEQRKLKIVSMHFPVTKKIF